MMPRRFTGGVEKGDAKVDGRADHGDRLLFVRGGAQVEA
jgi:hypothetical protein